MRPTPNPEEEVEEDATSSEEEEGSEASEEGSSSSEEDEVEEEPMVEEDVDMELKKMRPPPPTLSKEFFVKTYGFVDEGVIPGHGKVWGGVRFDDNLCVKVFGKVVGKGGRYGYAWKCIPNRKIRQRLEDLLPALYGRQEVPQYIPHKLARAVVLEDSGVVVNWPSYGVEVNKTQRRSHNRNVKRLELLRKSLGTVDRSNWRRIHVNPKELHSEVCEGGGSSFGLSTLDAPECQAK